MFTPPPTLAPLPEAAPLLLREVLPAVSHGAMLASIVCVLLLLAMARLPVRLRVRRMPHRRKGQDALVGMRLVTGQARVGATSEALLLALLGACAGLFCACDGADAVIGADGGDSPRLSWISVVSGPSALPEACRARQAESFPQLVAHPGEPGRLSAVYFQDGNLAAVGASSLDGGRSWWRAPVSDASACAGGPAERDRLFNPLFEAASDGWVYYGASHGRVSLHAAQDAAGLWIAGVEPGDIPVEDSAENLNLLSDPVQPGRVQALWTRYDYPAPEPFPVFTSSELWTAVSHDHGQTFGAAALAARAPLGSLVINGRLARSSDGGMLACYDTVPVALLANSFTVQRTEFSVYCTRSSDGEQWTAPAWAGTSVFLPLPDPEGRQTAGSDDEGIAYSAKFDLATGPDGLAALVHADLVEGVGQIRLALSRDGGMVWGGSELVIERSAPAFMPAVAIDRHGGIGIFWYDWTGDSPGDDALSTDAWFAYSADAGLSWNIEHLAGPFNLRGAYDAELGYDGGALGAYQDLVALADGFGVLFTVGPPLAANGPTDVLFARLEGR